MIATAPDERIARVSRTPSQLGRERMPSRRGEPLFLADWMRVLMMHFEVDALELQRAVPYQLDLYGGRAFSTLVAFLNGEYASAHRRKSCRMVVQTHRHARLP